MGVSGDGQIFPVPPIVSGMREATNFKFGRYIHRVHPSKSLLKIWEKRERGVSRDCPNFSSAPYYLRNAYIYEVQIWQRPCEQKTLKNLEKGGRWRIQGLPKCLKYSLLSQERIKLRTSNLASIFRGSMRTNAL